MNIYLVENIDNSPGRITAVFAKEEDAHLFADLLEEAHTVVERTLFQGQPPIRGFNK